MVMKMIAAIIEKWQIRSYSLLLGAHINQMTSKLDVNPSKFDD